jgi:predicted phage terminase large subunit-like protein
LILIEDHVSGIGLIQTLKQRRLPIKGIKPTGDKVMRMHAHTGTIEGTKVFLKAGASWLDDLRSELLAFPHGHHDDQVDALSQLMTWDAERRLRTARSLPIKWNSPR